MSIDINTELARVCQFLDWCDDNRVRIETQYRAGRLSDQPPQDWYMDAPVPPHAPASEAPATKEGSD